MVGWDRKSYITTSGISLHAITLQENFTVFRFSVHLSFGFWVWLLKIPKEVMVVLHVSDLRNATIHIISCWFAFLSLCIVFFSVGNTCTCNMTINSITQIYFYDVLFFKFYLHCIYCWSSRDRNKQFKNTT